MAYQRYYGYQYETSPRKVQPEYDTNKKKRQYKKKSTAKKASKAKINTEKQEVKNKAKMNSRAKLVLYITISFAVLFGISYRNSLISESFDKKEKLKTELSSLQKENEQLKVNIESSLNLKNVEQQAKEKLGMKKLDNNQKIYVNLPKKDFIEPATEEIIIGEELNFWQKLWNGITGQNK